MTPEQIAKLITDDVRTNNGLIIESPMDWVRKKLGLGSAESESKSESEITDSWRQIKQEFNALYPESNNRINNSIIWRQSYDKLIAAFKKVIDFAGEVSGFINGREAQDIAKFDSEIRSAKNVLSQIMVKPDTLTDISKLSPAQLSDDYEISFEFCSRFVRVIDNTIKQLGLNVGKPSSTTPGATKYTGGKGTQRVAI